MEIAVWVKRVPMVGGRIEVTADGQEVDTRMSGFAISPHEECAVEEAIQITERLGGTVTVLTLGPPDAADQLRDALALGAGRAVLLETDGREWGPIATAGAIAAHARRQAGDGQGYDLLLLGNEAADTGDYQVGVRVAHMLGWPCVTGIKHIEITDGPTPGVRAKRAAIEGHQPQWQPEGMRKVALRVPETERKQATVLGHGVDAVPALVRLLEELGVLS
jgi:electron transfer flavoprotein beta subunit